MAKPRRPAPPLTMAVGPPIADLIETAIASLECFQGVGLTRGPDGPVHTSSMGRQVLTLLPEAPATRANARPLSLMVRRCVA